MHVLCVSARRVWHLNRALSLMTTRATKAWTPAPRDEVHFYFMIGFSFLNAGATAINNCVILSGDSVSCIE